MDEFSKKHGTILCRELLDGCDLMTEEGQEYFKENDLLGKLCVPCVQSIVMILEEKP